MYPRWVGRYELLAELGAGGMGTVHLGRAPDGRIVALKTMNGVAIGGDSGRGRFEREAAALRRVDDPHVAAFVDADLAGPEPYLVTEYVQGRPLDAVLAEGPLAPDDLGRLGLGLARALDAVHGAGLIHRDVKPANIMMAGGGPVLIDLGIAHHLDQTRMTTRPIGTLRYMAPELLAEQRPGGAADVFGWGAVMAHAATGRPCFPADAIPALVNQILTMEPDLSDVPAWLRDVVGRALAKDPADRPSVRSLREAVTRRPQVELLQAAYAGARAAHDHARAEGIAFGLHAVAAAADDRVLVAKSLLDQADAARYSGAMDRAETLFEQARAASAAAGSRRDEGWAWDGLGVCRRHRKDDDLAGKAFEEALAIGEEVGDTALRGWNLCNLADLDLRRGNFANATACYDAALTVAVDHPAIELDALKGLARCAREQGDLELAASLLEDTAHRAEEVEDLRTAGWAWYDAAEDVRGKPDHERAKSDLENALRIAGRLGDRLMEGWTLCKLGSRLRDIGATREAATAYERARDVADALRDKKMREYATVRLDALSLS
ncbi:protein kinase domain-containing protein [Actinomadura violacea]|uniref:Serine/threonine protein kinase n=1 Tax=Actinomadura violacea TaxID=2819934 RepID=A0ABS3RT00_9ACTN|nr:tetratricopeptide repeat-containing serine/threonine-protein kinase [Actinomadura violacea]MBO2459896.1 serine/threonine protein kinase [Actinomadura violacea]